MCVRRVHRREPCPSRGTGGSEFHGSEYSRGGVHRAEGIPSPPSSTGRARRRFHGARRRDEDRARFTERTRDDDDDGGTSDVRVIAAR